MKNHRQSLYKLIFSLPFLLTFSVDLNRCLSVIVSVSPLCFSGGLFRTSLFKTDFLCLFATLTLSHSLISSFTLRCHYSLPNFIPTIDSRSLMFWQVIRGGVAYSRLKALHFCHGKYFSCRRQTSHLRSRYFTPALRRESFCVFNS